MNGEHLDLSSDPDGAAEASRKARTAVRPFVGVHFACCEVYSRVYKNREETAYVGSCPRCRRRITFPIGPGGTKARFFRAE